MISICWIISFCGICFVNLLYRYLLLCLYVYIYSKKYTVKNISIAYYINAKKVTSRVYGVNKKLTNATKKRLISVPAGHTTFTIVCDILL